MGAHALEEEEEDSVDLFAEEPPQALHEREWSPVDVGGPTSLLIEPMQAEVWGSALILSRWLMQRPDTVRNRRVAELGAGAGLPSLTAALCGAESVVVTDYDRFSVDAAARAAAHNYAVTGVAALGRVRAERLDWKEACLPGFTPSWGPGDVLIAADCNYYSRASPWLVAAVMAHLAEGGTLLLASRDGRAGLDKCLALLRAQPGLLESQQRQSFSAADHLWTFERRAKSGGANSCTDLGITEPLTCIQGQMPVGASEMRSFVSL